MKNIFSNENGYTDLKIKKNFHLLLVFSFISACSSNVTPLTYSEKGSTYNRNETTEKDISVLDKEYSFNDKALTQSYLLRKLNKWLDTGNGGINTNGTQLVKEIIYARNKHPNLFLAILSDDLNLRTAINSVDEVAERKAIDPVFENFLEAAIPPVFKGEFQVNTYTTGNQQHGKVTYRIIVIMEYLPVDIIRLEYPEVLSYRLIPLPPAIKDFLQLQWIVLAIS
jgi:hypothetical protein